MGLSSKESKMLENLLKKKDEPDAPGVGRNINVSIDLGDAAQVERAQKLGLLGMLDDDEGEEEEEEEEDVPKRRGYFNGDK